MRREDSFTRGNLILELSFRLRNLYLLRIIQMIKKVNTNTYENGVVDAIGANSVVFPMHAFVTKTAQFLGLATAGSIIDGIAMEGVTTASDNQTVAKYRVNYEEPKDSTRLLVAITGGTITEAKEGDFYDLDDAETVDGTTESATTGQLQMTKFHTATLCEFKIVNA